MINKEHLPENILTASILEDIPTEPFINLLNYPSTHC